MDKPIPEAVVLAAKQAAYAADPETVLTTAATRAALTAAQQPDHIVDATKMVAQQQGQAVAWQYRFRRQLPNGGMCRWHECSEGEAKSLECDVYEVRALYTTPQPMQQGGGDVCETCDGAGHVVTYADPYDRGDVSSPEQSPCPACTAPPSAPVGVEEWQCRCGLRGPHSSFVAHADCPLRPAHALAQQPAAVDGANREAQE